MKWANKIRITGLVTAILVSGTLVTYATFSFAAEPKQVVERFHGVLISVMKSATTTEINTRYKRLEPAIEKAFNLPFMIRVTAGSRWKKASQKEKRDLMEAFKRMSVGTYASRFDSYTGQTFRTQKVRVGPKRTQLVDTVLKSPNGKTVKLTYVMRKFGEKWKIIDLLLDQGISEMAVRVSEYRAILRSRGAGALAKALDQKAAKLLKH